MSETKRIADELRRAYEGEAWHGPSLGELLKGVTPEQAARRCIAGAHTIWELVLHIAAWEAFACAALAGTPMPDPTPEQDWPPVCDTSPQAWAEVLTHLAQTQAALEAAVHSFPESRLSEIVPGRKYNYYFLLHGIVQHNLYHAGQIALLKKV